MVHLNFSILMKHLATLYLIILTVFLSNSCVTKSHQNINLYRTWMLVEFRNYPKDELIRNKISLVISAEKNYAVTECSEMRLEIRTMGKEFIKISNFKENKNSCSENDSLTREFKEELGNIKFFTIEGHFLTLKKENGQAMKFVAADWD